MADQGEGALAQYGGFVGLVGGIAAAVAGGIAGALNFRSRLAATEARISVLEDQATKRDAKDASIRDEARSGIRELGDEVRKSLASAAVDRDPTSVNIRGLVEAIAGPAVSAALVPHISKIDKLDEKIDTLRERVSDINGYVRGVIARGDAGRS
jgi:hypothetical protein